MADHDDNDGADAGNADQQRQQEHDAKLRRLSTNAESEALPLLAASYPVRIFVEDIHRVAPRAPMAADAAAAPAAAADIPHRNAQQVVHHFILAVPDRLMQKGDGLLNCVRGEGADGTLGGHYQRALEFVLQSMAGTLQILHRMASHNADVARANAAVPPMRVFLECVVRDTPATLPLVRLNVDGSPSITGPSSIPSDAGRPLLVGPGPDAILDKLTVQQYTLTFAPENILGYRLHVWIFDHAMHPSRMFAQQVLTNQLESGLITPETAAVRAVMLTGNADDERVKRRIWDLRVAKYREKHPDADMEELQENVPVPNAEQVRLAKEQASIMPSPVEVKDARIQYQRSATELGYSIYSYHDMAQYVHGLYATCAGRAVPHDGLFVEPFELEDQTLAPGKRGHVMEMAHWKIFNFKNSVDVLHHQNDMATMDPHQACAARYGLDTPDGRLSFPYPHLVWELPIEVLNPCILVLYKAPWRLRTTYGMLCNRYEQAIQQSQEREKRALASARQQTASASAVASPAPPVATNKLTGVASTAIESFFMNVANSDAETRQTGRFGDKRRGDAETARMRHSMIMDNKATLAAVGRSSTGISRTQSSLFVAAAASASARAGGDDPMAASADEPEISVDNDAEAADPCTHYHQRLTNYEYSAKTGMCFDRLFTVDTPQKDFSAQRIDNTITILRQEHAPMFDRINRIVSQWPPKHARPPHGALEWTQELREREQERCARELSDALFQETARRYVHRLSSLDRNMSDLFIGIMKRMQSEDPAAFIQPAFVRMPDYTLSAQCNAALLRDLGEAHNLRTLGTFAREAMVHMGADAVRPAHFVAAPRANVAPPGTGKSLSTSVAMKALPIPDYGPVQHESKLSKMGGDRNQSHTVHVRDEMPSILQNHSHENHERRRDEVEMAKSLITMQAATFERLGKDQTSGAITRARVRIERQYTEWVSGNYVTVPLNAESALFDRYRWIIEIPLYNWSSGTGSANGQASLMDDSAHAVYNFGRVRSEEAQRLFADRNQRATCVKALVASASDCQVLPRFDTSVFGVMMTAGLEELRRFLPGMAHMSRLLIRGHTLAYAEALNTMYFRCLQSPASPYFVWDTNTHNVVGVHPFRLETMRERLGTSLFCQPPDALNALTMTFYEYYPRSAWFVTMVAACMLCGFDPSKFKPLYESANFLPDVRGRAREFLPVDKRGVVKPPVPEFVEEMDRVLEDMRFMSRTLFPNGAIYDVDTRSGCVNPTFVVFNGSYETFLQRLTALLQRYGRVDVPQVRSVLNIMRRMQFNTPLMRLVPRGLPVDSASIAFEQVDEEMGGSRNTNAVPHLRSAPQDGGLRESTSAGRTAVWRSYAALTVCSTHHQHAANNSRYSSAASALTTGKSSTTTSGGAAAGANSDNVSSKDEGGDTIKLLVHALMLRPDHLFYMFVTAWMDETTEAIKTLLPVDVFEHPAVWHQLQLGPRYGVRLNVRNPNYRSDASRVVLDSYDLSMINQVLPGDNRSVASVIAENVEAGTRMPIIAYRYSMVFDRWLAYLRDNHIYPSERELTHVRDMRARLIASPADANGLAGFMPQYLLNKLCKPASESGMTDYEAWAAMHRDRYLAPEYFVRTMQAASPQLLSMLTAPIEVVDKLQYPQAVVLSSECERYIHTIVTKRMAERKRSNAGHAIDPKRCVRTLRSDERALLDRFRDVTILEADATHPLPRALSELGALLNNEDDDEADRSYNMSEIIIQTCVIKAVIKNEKALLRDMPPPESADDMAKLEHKEKTRSECVNELVKCYRRAIVPHDDTERAQGQLFLARAPPMLARLHDRMLTMLYEYYVMRISHLKSRACKRYSVLKVDMFDQLRADGRTLTDAVIDKTVLACFSPLEQLLLDDTRMKKYVLASAPKKQLGAPSKVAAAADADASADDDDNSDANIADSNATMASMRARTLGSNLSYLYSDNEVTFSESEANMRRQHRRGRVAPTSSSAAAAAAASPVPVVLRRTGGFSQPFLAATADKSKKPRSNNDMESEEEEDSSSSGGGGAATHSPKGSTTAGSGEEEQQQQQTSLRMQRKRQAISMTETSATAAPSIVLQTPAPTRPRHHEYDARTQALHSRIKAASAAHSTAAMLTGGGGGASYFTIHSALTKRPADLQSAAPMVASATSTRVAAALSSSSSSSPPPPLQGRMSTGTLEADDEMNL